MQGLNVNKELFLQDVAFALPEVEMARAVWEGAAVNCVNPQRRVTKFRSIVEKVPFVDIDLLNLKSDSFGLGLGKFLGCVCKNLREEMRIWP